MMNIPSMIRLTKPYLFILSPRDLCRWMNSQLLFSIRNVLEHLYPVVVAVCYEQAVTVVDEHSCRHVELAPADAGLPEDQEQPALAVEDLDTVPQLVGHPYVAFAVHGNAL